MNLNFPSTLTLLDKNCEAFQNARGAIPYKMTNDYMFRAVLQTNNHVLRGLISSLLHLDEEEIITVRITNPVILGKSIKSKEFRLDIHVLLNDHTLINLEMQITNKLNWQKRSVIYLCRSYDQLHHGQDYREAKPAIHIAFLDYTLFPDAPEFYATYQLMNIKNHQIYSSNLTLSVVDLCQIDLATEEDKRYHINDWAALFKADTWEDIKMLATKNEYLMEASQTMFQLNADDQIRKQCQDREEYQQDMRNYERALFDRDLSIAGYQKALSDKDTELSTTKEELSTTKGELSTAKEELSTTKGELSTAKEELSAVQAELSKALAELERLKTGI